MIKRIFIVYIAVVISTIHLPAYVFATGFDVEKIYPSVVIVYSGKSVGSGFAVDRHRIITNAHVIETTDVVVQTYAGDRYSASIEALSSDLDIAILSVAATSFVALIPAYLDAVTIGDDVYAIGAPNAMTYTLTRGIVSAKREVDGIYYVQTDAAINKGNSGGPLINHRGEVIGVNTLKISDSEGISFALPIKTIYDYISHVDSVDNTHTEHSTTVSEDGIKTHDIIIMPTSDNWLTVEMILASALSISVILNLLLLFYNYKLRKDILQHHRVNTERTDFDIEIIV